jgi:hypothetical protein
MFGKYLPHHSRHKKDDTAWGVLALIQKVDAVKVVKEVGSKKLKCIFFPMSI